MPNNDPMVEDELCNILYHMVKHDWHEALHKSGRTASNMTVMELEEYFEQIELLDNLKQKFNSAKETHNTKDCKRHKVITEKRSFKRSSEHMSVHELYASNQKLTRKLKKLQKKGKTCETRST
eukprot:2890772-Ditylum_brightwellii.AAC.1